MKKIVLTISVLITVMTGCFAQLVTPEEYIAQYKDLAIREMKRMGVPAAISLAQGLLETESGNSDLFKKSNNHFGIKCKNTWTADGVTHDDDAKGECFRSYKDAEASYRDHSNFLRGSDRYAFLFQLDPLDYKGWAYGLKNAGYATNPNYPAILIKNIEQYNLQQYSLEAVNDVPKVEKDKYKDDPNTYDDKDQSEDVSSNETTSDSPGSTIIINGDKCLYEKKGTSLLAIATENNINLNSLLAFNDLSEDGILNKDQVIFLQKKSKRGEKNFYVVQEGETLYDVAQKNGIQLQSLLDYNQLKADDNVYPGTKLYLQPGEAINQSSQVAESKAKYCYVQPKEGLYSISKKYGVSMQQLRDWNNLQTDSLIIGQQLKIAQ
jgi:LysM repeat protein